MRNIKQCIICGNDFYAPPSSMKVCCSPECSRLNRQQMQASGIYDQSNKNWLKKKKEFHEKHTGEEHVNAKFWRIQSPTGDIYEMVNLKSFIRDNIDLFDGSTVRQAFDGIVKIKASQQGKRKRMSYSYKGWKLLDWRD